MCLGQRGGLLVVSCVQPRGALNLKATCLSLQKCSVQRHANTKGPYSDCILFLSSDVFFLFTLNGIKFLKKSSVVAHVLDHGFQEAKP